jgi:phosphoglycolate phosphatase
MRLIVFDCDGTIVDSQAGIVLSMEHAFKSLRMVPPTRAQTLSVIGLSLPEAFSALAPEAEAGTRLELAEHYKRAFRELDADPMDLDLLFPNAKEIIEALAATEGTMLGIATGKSRRGVDRLFDRECWHRHFSTVQTADDHPSKPHPSMVLAAMRETGATPAATVVVGDTSYDMQMARAAGCGSIGVAWGYHTAEELTEAGASVIIEKFEQLPLTIEKLVPASSCAA